MAAEMGDQKMTVPFTFAGSPSHRPFQRSGNRNFPVGAVSTAHMSEGI